MRGGGTGLFSVSELSGGMNRRQTPVNIRDDQLVTAQNLWWKDGALQSRPAFNRAAVTKGPHADGTPVRQQIFRAGFRVAYAGKLCDVVTVKTLVRYAQEQALALNLSVYLVSRREIAASGLLMSGAGGEELWERNTAALPSADAQTVLWMYFNGDVYALRASGEGALNFVRAGDDSVPEAVSVYVPTVLINGTPGYGPESYRESVRLNGLSFEGYSLVSPRFRCLFTSGERREDAAFTFYCLPCRVNRDRPVTVSWVGPEGEVELSFIPALGSEIESGGQRYRIEVYNRDGSNTAVVAVSGNPFYGTVSDDLAFTVERLPEDAQKNREEFAGICGTVVFGTTDGSRIFAASGAKLFWTDPGNPTYISENSYAVIGSASDPITALGRQADFLAVFKARSAYKITYTDLAVDPDAVAQGVSADVSAAGIDMRMTVLSRDAGCDCPGTLVSVLNRLTWMNADGALYTVLSSGFSGEDAVARVGANIRARIEQCTAPSGRQNASAGIYEDHFLLQIENRAFLFDFRDDGFRNLSSREKPDATDTRLAWFEWLFPPAYAQGIPVSGGFFFAVKRTVDPDTVYGRYAEYAALTFADTQNTSYTDIWLTADGGEPEPMRDAVRVAAETKHFRFDRTGYQRILGLFLDVTGEGVTVNQIADGETFAPVAWKSPMRFYPANISRCRDYGVRVCSERPIAITGMAVCYRVFGTVR